MYMCHMYVTYVCMHVGPMYNYVCMYDIVCMSILYMNVLYIFDGLPYMKLYFLLCPIYSI